MGCRSKIRIRSRTLRVSSCSRIYRSWLLSSLARLIRLLSTLRDGAGDRLDNLRLLPGDGFKDRLLIRALGTDLRHEPRQILLHVAAMAQEQRHHTDGEGAFGGERSDGLVERRAVLKIA